MKYLAFLPLLLMAGCQTIADRTDTSNNAQLIYNLAGATITPQVLADIQTAATKIGNTNGTPVDLTQGIAVIVPAAPAPTKASP